MSDIERILRMSRRGEIPGLIEVTGLCRSALYKRIREGTFPTGVRLGPRARGWPESQVREWLQEREAAE